MKKSMTPHERRLEEFRHFYFTRYGMRLDDELILLLMRMSEMHRDLRKEIRNQPRIQLRHGRDYFWHGFGRVTGLLILLLLVMLTASIWIRR